MIRSSASWLGALARGFNVELFLLAACSGGACPAVYSTSSGHVVVQGEPVPAGEVDIVVPAHERLVQIPQSVLLEAAASLGPNAVT